MGISSYYAYVKYQTFPVKEFLDQIASNVLDRYTKATTLQLLHFTSAKFILSIQLYI